MHPSYGEELNVGDRIAGRYEILSETGKGSMGVVYKARHDILGRIVAIKMLRVQRMTDERSKARFEREARAAERLSHPNLINVMDFGYTPEGIPYLIMDYVSGIGLFDILRREKILTPERAVRLYAQVCDAIYHAHQRGVIHRDLKPGNILIVKDENGQETVKIVDLGVAKIVHGAEDEAPAITGTGEVCGSPIYLSPEQCMHLELDPRTDIYSLGVCLYESLTGVPPLRGATVYDTIYMHVHEMPKPFGAVAPGVTISPRLETVVFRCLSKKPDERYETMEQLKLALLETLQPAQSQAVHVLPPEMLFKPSTVARPKADSFKTASFKRPSGDDSRFKSVFLVGGASLCVVAVIVSLFVYISGQNQKIRELEIRNGLRSNIANSAVPNAGSKRNSSSVPQKQSAPKPQPGTGSLTHAPQVHGRTERNQSAHYQVQNNQRNQPVAENRQLSKSPAVRKNDGSLLTAFGALQMQDRQKHQPGNTQSQFIQSNQTQSRQTQSSQIQSNQTPMRRIELPSIQAVPAARDEPPVSKPADKSDSAKLPNSPAQIAEEGRNLALIHDYAGATAKFKQVRQMEPTNQYYASCLAHALTSEALLLNRQGNYKGAVAKQREAADLFPENQLYQNNLRKFEANLENFSARQ